MAKFLKKKVKVLTRPQKSSRGSGGKALIGMFEARRDEKGKYLKEYDAVSIPVKSITAKRVSFDKTGLEPSFDYWVPSHVDKVNMGISNLSSIISPDRVTLRYIGIEKDAEESVMMAAFEEKLKELIVEKEVVVTGLKGLLKVKVSKGLKGVGPKK